MTLVLEKIFGLEPKAKAKINKRDDTKLKSFCKAKKTKNKINRQLMK